MPSPIRSQLDEIIRSVGLLAASPERRQARLALAMLTAAADALEQLEAEERRPRGQQARELR